MASSSVGGLSGAFIPVSEDAGMIDAAEAGTLTLEKLEAMTAVCSVGLDMIVLPGDTPADTISAIIADEAAIGMVNSKTTAVRVIPAIGHEAGEVLDFGGLLGTGPIMKMKKYYRPPQGKYSESNLKMAKKMGYHTIFWSLAYVDWYESDQPTREEALEKMVPRIHPGAIVLLHSTSATNAQVLDELLTKWEDKGYSFKRVDQLT